MCKSTVDASTFNCQCDKGKTPVDSLVSHLSRSDIFAISQLLSAATAIDVAYTTLQLIPNRAAFDLKIDLAKELRRLRELHEQAVNIAISING